MADKDKPKVPAKMEQIIRNGTELMMRHGIRRVTVEEICRKAGVSKMTFYKYFENKTALVKHIFNVWFEEFRERADRVMAVRKPFTEELDMLFSWKVGLVEKLGPEFIEDYLHLDPEMQRFMADYNRRAYELFIELLVDWQRCGDIRPELKPELVLAAIDKVQEMFADENLRRLYGDDVAFLRELHKLFFFGVVPRPDADRAESVN